jgi:hypothetical protein
VRRDYLSTDQFKTEPPLCSRYGGVVRDSEMFNNVPDAWQNLKLKLETEISKITEVSKKAA